LVKLINVTGSEQDNRTTNETGYYEFTNLSSGEYRVKFELPSGFLFSPKDQAFNDSIDSDANPSTGITDPIIIVPGEQNMDVDCGIVPNPGSIGDLVWNDTDEDGIQDLGESGASGISVKLINATGSEQDNRTTNETGYYEFTNLSSSEYRVKFELPSEFRFSPMDMTDDKNDSDVNLVNGTTDPIIIGPGDRNMDVDCGISRTNPTVIVFALDTSGSMKKYYRLAPNESSEIVSGWSVFNNATVSIVSWDHESELVFGPAPLTGNEIRIAEVLDSLSARCIETDLTRYDQGLNGSLAALRESASLAPNSSKIIIFLTGFSEFEPGENLDDYISEANESGCKIFTIGIGINESFNASMMQFLNLSKISERTGGEFSSVTAFGSRDLNSVMSNITRQVDAISDPDIGS